MHMDEEGLIRRIKGKKWDARVQRPGYLQPKAILCDAEVRPLTITSGITIKSENSIWVRDSKLYDDGLAEEMWGKFELAFKRNKRWFAPWVSRFDSLALEVVSFERSMERSWGQATLAEKGEYFGKYAELLMRVQKYYSVAVPLAGYCEAMLSMRDPALLRFAFPYKKLDLTRMHESLAGIKGAQGEDSPIRENRIQEHLRKYAWIKANYGLLESYTREELMGELEADLSEANEHEIPRTENSHLLSGLQIGIYLRSRIKELSQRIWFAFEPLCVSISGSLSINRGEFLTLLPEEATQSIDSGACLVDGPELKKRKAGFIVGVLDGNRIMLTGKMVDELFDYYSVDGASGKGEIAGTCASPGSARGKVRIIRGGGDFAKLNEGEILVAPMTTPDFVVVMKRAGAIVTDEGGLSCHAAIVSRELRVPCIVGTKIATKALKDGELVEVDATNGMVRKIS